MRWERRWASISTLVHSLSYQFQYSFRWLCVHNAAIEEAVDIIDFDFHSICALVRRQLPRSKPFLTRWNFPTNSDLLVKLYQSIKRPIHQARTTDIRSIRREIASREHEMKTNKISSHSLVFRLANYAISLSLSPAIHLTDHSGLGERKKPTQNQRDGKCRTAAQQPLTRAMANIR